MNAFCQTILIDIVLVTILCKSLRRNYDDGVILCLSFLIVLPQSVGLVISDAIPVLTTHRLLIMVLLVFGIRNGAIRFGNIPFLGLWLGIVLTNALTLAVAPYPQDAFKLNISFVVERMLFFLVCISSFKTEQLVQRVMHVVFASIAAISLLGVVEWRTGFKVLQIIPQFWQPDLTSRLIQCTLPHPIHLGIMMAIGISLGVWSAARSELRSDKVVSWLAIGAMGCVLYCNVTRGPWIGAMLGGVSQFFLSSQQLRRVLARLACLAIIPVLLMPGVRDTIFAAADSTMASHSKNNPEYASYAYRWELWRIAWDRISESPQHLYLGYGILYHTKGDFSGEFKSDVLAGRKSNFQSWDNEYATILLEQGVIGLALHLLLYSWIVGTILKATFRAEGFRKEVCATAFSVVIIVFFMMTNVKIFSQQIWFVLLAVAACGLNLARRELPSDPDVSDERSENSGLHGL